MRLRGFTLVELLVATAVTLLLAGLLLAAATTLLQGWSRAQGKTTATVGANLVLEQLEQDIQSAILRDFGSVWLDGRVLNSVQMTNRGWELNADGIIKPEAESLRLLPSPENGAPSNIADARFGRSGLWLRFVTSDYDNGTMPVAVSYQLRRYRTTSSATSPIRYALFRERLSSAATLPLLSGQIFSESEPAALNEPDHSHVIATNVIDFGIWLYSRNASGEEIRQFPTSNQGSEGVSGNTERPFVLCMIRILTEEGAARIDAIENGWIQPPPGIAPGAWWWEQAEAHSEVFVRRIEVKGRAQ